MEDNPSPGICNLIISVTTPLIISVCFLFSFRDIHSVCDRENVFVLGSLLLHKWHRVRSDLPDTVSVGLFD